MNEKLDLIILKYNMENVRVLPIIARMKPLLMEYYKKDAKKRTKGNSLYLISGNNYVPRAYWEACKEHVMVKALIDNGIIEEIENTDSKVLAEKRKLEAKKIAIIEEKEKLDEEIPELEEKVEKKKEEVEKAAPGEKKVKEKEVKEMEKEVKEKKKDAKKLEEEETLTDEELKVIEESVYKFSKMTKKKKSEIIAETFDVRTLEKFLEEEGNSDIRHDIQMRIKEVLEAKTDETIGHPKSHLKTSGK